MKLSVIYDSRSGNTEKAAEWIAEGMREVPGTETGVYHISAVDEDFAKDSAGIVIGSPSYGTMMTPDLHAWFQSGFGKLSPAGKLGGAFSTAQFTHGGGELVVQSLLMREITAGMLCYSGGSAYGMPIIHLGPVGINDNVEKHNGMDNYREYFRVFGKRFAEKAAQLSGIQG